MILINESPFEAQVLRTTLSEAVMVATVVAKATYTMTDFGDLELCARQRGVLLEPTTIEGVEFPPDAGYGKRGVDLLAIGSAFAAGGPTRMLMAGMSIDDAYFGLAVIGDRRWRRRWPGWGATDPEPFTEMPMSWQRAFGGHARVNGAELPCVDNRLGKGYVLDPAAAEGVELPNIESCPGLIRNVWDQPRPVSFCPLPIGTNYTADVLADVDADGRGVTTEIYNVAIPAHRLSRYPAGARLRLHNLAPNTGLPREFSLPATRVVAEVSVGAAHHEFVSEVDTILVIPARQELVLTHRIVFRYDYARGLPRVVRVRCTELEGARAREQAVA